MVASPQNHNTATPQRTHQLDADILFGIIAASSDACWCMEFGEPVDLTAPDREIVRQVFENDPFWRFSNPAMAQLYLLDSGKDFNAQPVADIFPWNEQNEAFVRSLIRNGFEMDAGPALDTRYDGVEILVENDVRAHIEGGFLLRIFGIVRDVGKHRRREERIKAELDETLVVLSDLPCGVVAFNAAGEVILVNPAACEVLGVMAETLISETLEVSEDHAWAQDLVEQVIGSGQGRATEQGGVRWTLAPKRGGGAIGYVTQSDEKAHQE